MADGFEIGDSFYIREVPVEQDPFELLTISNCL